MRRWSAGDTMGKHRKCESVWRVLACRSCRHGRRSRVTSQSTPIHATTATQPLCEISAADELKAVHVSSVCVMEAQDTVSDGLQCTKRAECPAIQTTMQANGWHTPVDGHTTTASNALEHHDTLLTSHTQPPLTSSPGDLNGLCRTSSWAHRQSIKKARDEFFQVPSAQAAAQRSTYGTQQTLEQAGAVRPTTTHSKSKPQSDISPSDTVPTDIWLQRPRQLDINSCSIQPVFTVNDHGRVPGDVTDGVGVCTVHCLSTGSLQFTWASCSPVSPRSVTSVSGDGTASMGRRAASSQVDGLRIVQCCLCR